MKTARKVWLSNARHLEYNRNYMENIFPMHEVMKLRICKRGIRKHLCLQMYVNTTDIHIPKTSMNFYQLLSDNSVGFQYMLTTSLCNLLCKAWCSQFWYQNNNTWLFQEQEKTAAAKKTKNPPLLNWPLPLFLCIMIQVKTFFKIKNCLTKSP